MGVLRLDAGELLMPRRGSVGGLYAPISGLARAAFNLATGGTITTFTAAGQAGTVSGHKYQVHSFSAGGTLTVLNALKPFDLLLVGGGYDGESYLTHTYGGGGGGVLQQLAVVLAAQAYAVVVGGPNGLGSNGGGSSVAGYSVSGGSSNGTSGAPTAYGPSPTYGPSGDQYRAGGGAGGGGSGGDIIPGNGAYYGPGLSKDTSGSSVAYAPGNYGYGGNAGLVIVRYEIAP